MSIDTLERPDTIARPDTDVGDDLNVHTHEKTTPEDGSNKDKTTHIVDKNALTEAIFNATPITAICGHTWVPSLDPPKQYPVCAKCLDIYENAPWKAHGPNDGEPPL